VKLKVRNPVFIKIETDKQRYLSNEEIVLAITISNKKADTLELLFNTTQRYDFLVYKDSRLVWRWSEDKFFAMTIETLNINAGESLIFTEKWEPTALMPGIYTAVGLITSQPRYKASCTFKVHRSSNEHV
jgi:hypothetical protein